MVKLKKKEKGNTVLQHVLHRLVIVMNHRITEPQNDLGWNGP